MKHFWSDLKPEVSAYYPLKKNSGGAMMVLATGKLQKCKAHDHLRIVPFDERLRPVEVEPETRRTV